MAKNLSTHSSIALRDSTDLVHRVPPRRRGFERAADDLDWLSLGRTLWRRKLFLLSFVGIVLGLTAAYVSRLPPAYEAEALVMLNEQQFEPVPEIEDVLTGLPLGENGIQSQLLLITSRGTAERIVDELNLHLLPEFNPALQMASAEAAAEFYPSRIIAALVLEIVPPSWAVSVVKQLVEAGADMAGLVLSRVNVRKHARYSYRDSGYNPKSSRCRSGFSDVG